MWYSGAIPIMNHYRGSWYKFMAQNFDGENIDEFLWIHQSNFSH